MKFLDYDLKREWFDPIDGVKNLYVGDPVIYKDCEEEEVAMVGDFGPQYGVEERIYSNGCGCCSHSYELLGVMRFKKFLSHIKREID